MANLWFLVVVFTGIDGRGLQDVYIFDRPNFATKNECVISANNPVDQRIYMGKIISEYGYPRMVDKVLCVPENKVNQIIKSENSEV